MSVDINWETLTEGPDGLRLAEAVRAFVHSKFQSVPLPRFIRSVQVRAFDFGNVSPEVEIKDVCDPLPDFYDEVDYTDSESDGDSNGSRDDNVASGLRDGSPAPRDPSSRPPSQHASSATGVHTARTQSKDGSGDRPPYFPSEHGAPSPPRMSTMREQNQSPEDIQVVAHVRYAGDLRLSLTAEILLDYPMPSFVGIPLQLNVTGLTFDGVALVAFVKKRRRAHLCFLAPEDAEAVLGGDGLDDEEDEGEGRRPVGGKMGGLLEEIRVESEIGQRENGKQVLKNVGKVEKFVLEQVRRIFEDEFVYPSFWTFLV
ncbi:hypothetical protein EJ06DRAFT_555531 [Trichodelitschia bisporula]|uniref:Mitochondrial distribution and morphology protein 12 n=1 Tax=Trichodelitschia bisporula TaxID=703511 RepID=A0A6G1I160_9PEZI|nr:hypothetical protein EJ06DRAFT_555531 [Trichodelitschia bisporula]